ncbi:efflux RND transporter periplasmic adaptor subunit [Sphingomonas sp. R647]|jgi:cobalt-zinc-cadmium efflux system membrane fusion protein|uniref:efflux RND transporter periplasmic adaptor subunit n=1 Tax=unclassified Sphingomonas TaxID=196159 RepID=UPI001CD3886A|nr:MULTISPECIES: efflux RND transporter periplasmic adaptor subunit [unclassified Sphingomonas]MCA1197889.1 efflux RND transporter periplasmic adaptor subunit [Sphingomonas sp. R647]MCR5871257.1 efflux RND transporter periplasmic adaptor subunit [Sphingomonas sp. J344]UUY00435.1 efflux RND transporter periplasmic adaptor subunit [Sphingomonas sp. J315]
MARIHAALAAALILPLPLIACGGESATENTASEAEGAPAADYERGPHNGRMLRDGNFAVEMTIFEDGVPPEFRIYAYRDDKPVAPGEVQLSVALGRLDGEVNRFAFKPEADYLRGDGRVVEPHSFDVTVVAREGGRTHRWKYDSFEGRVSMPAAAARAAGLAFENAGPAEIGEALELIGRVELDPSATAEVGAKFPGRVVSASLNVGDRVRRGQVLARVESNESMQIYSVTAPISGVITERRTNPGDVAGSDPIYVIADPSRTTAAFPVFPRDMERVRAGAPVQLSLLEGNRTIGSTIRDFRPVADPMTGALVARAPLANRDGFWRPGMSVKGVLTVDQRQVPLAVKTEGLQAFRDFTVVFAKVGDTYEVRMLELGTRGPVWTEVKSGIKPGQSYVTKGSYVIKADIEKSGASHDH